MIPKIIHYCWFGGNPLPPLAKKCIKSWKKYCKGYELRRWDETNFDIAAAPLYVRQAYEAKKWAFVTDYVRLYAMTAYGGIYMDTDVEVVAKLDKFLHHRAFSGFESDVDIPTGIMACEKDFPLFREFLQYYDTARFVGEDGSLNLTTNVIIMTDICLKHGLIRNGRFQEVAGFALYPPEVFCPISLIGNSMNVTDRTHTIHWFSGSWLAEDLRREKQAWQKKVRRRARQRKRADLWDRISHLPNRLLLGLLGQARYDRLKEKLRK